MEHFQFWEVEDAIRAARVMPADFPIAGMTSYGTLLSEYSYEWYARDLVRPYYFTANERLPQYLTESVLRARVEELPAVDCWYGWSVEQVEQDDDGARVIIAETGTKGRRVLEGNYLAGCDGSRSVVREQAGITQGLSDHNRLMVLLVFRSAELHELLGRYPDASFFNVLHPDLEGYWRFLGRVDVGESWFFHAPVPPGTTRDNFDFVGLLHETVGAEFACEIEHVGFWDLRFAIADKYRAGRVFVLGDAAHSHPPYGGHGINLGFEDARNLGWKLAARLQRWGSDELLDSYEQERHPVFKVTAEEFILSYIENDRAFLSSHDPGRDRDDFDRAWETRRAGANADVQSFEPNYEGSPVVAGPVDGVCSARGSHEFTARSGHHLPPRSLSNGQSISDALGPGFTLLALDAAPDTIASFEQAAIRLSVPMRVVQDGYTGELMDYRSRLVLIRPDHFVAWTANEPPSDPVEVLRRCIGRLTPE
jgi:hypothetical protein